MYKMMSAGKDENADTPLLSSGVDVAEEVEGKGFAKTVQEEESS